MVLKDERPWLSFGVMGGDMQPQGHVQVLVDLIDFGMNVQEAAGGAFRHSATGLGAGVGDLRRGTRRAEARGHSMISSVGASAASRES